MWSRRHQHLSSTFEIFIDSICLYNLQLQSSLYFLITLVLLWWEWVIETQGNFLLCWTEWKGNWIWGPLFPWVNRMSYLLLWSYSLISIPFTTHSNCLMENQVVYCSFFMVSWYSFEALWIETQYSNRDFRVGIKFHRVIF